MLTIFLKDAIIFCHYDVIFISTTQIKISLITIVKFWLSTKSAVNTIVGDWDSLIAYTFL